MTAAVAYHPVLLPAGVPVSMASPNPSMHRSMEGRPPKAKSTQSGKDAKVVRGRRERPCDACRKRKSKCVTNEGQKNVCAACGVHGQECTYIEDPQPRKRRLEGDGKEVDLSKRRLVPQRGGVSKMGVREVDILQVGGIGITIGRDGRPNTQDQARIRAFQAGARRSRAVQIAS